MERIGAHETSRQISTAARATSVRRAEWGMVLAATTVAAALSFFLIGRKSFWVDEGISVYNARDWSQMMHMVFTYDINMSLYYLLLHVWLKLGDSEAFVRALSAILAIPCVPMLYVLGRRLFGGRAGVIAALLLAVNPFFVRYAQEARSYTLLILLVVLSSYCFVQAVERRYWTL